MYMYVHILYATSIVWVPEGTQTTNGVMAYPTSGCSMAGNFVESRTRLSKLTFMVLTATSARGWGVALQSDAVIDTHVRSRS